MEWLTSEKRCKKLKKDIEDFSFMLNKLRPNVEKDKSVNESYNRLLIERAISRQELNKCCKKKTLFSLKKYFTKENKEKTICEYFN